MQWSRRQFIWGTLGGLHVAMLPNPTKMRFGLVTYQWGRDWDIDALIANCVRARALGVELRTEHAHGVEPTLTKAQRAEVRQRFEDSPVELVGLGTNWAFHYSDAARLTHEIDGAKAAIVLSHDVGGSGVKVKPDALPADVPIEQTIRQIGESLQNVSEFAANYGQEVRLEVHGQGTSSLQVIRSIMEIADHPSCRVCWNSNEQDMNENGLQQNFELVRPWFGQTAHVREFDVGNYDYKQLVKLLVASDYNGWVLMEARTEPNDRIEALLNQRRLFERLVKEATD